MPANKTLGDTLNVESAASVTDDTLSVPLYLAGLVVTICGLQVVNATLGDMNFTATSLLLTVIGFVFSFGCRWLRVQLRIFEMIFIVGMIYLLYEVLGHRSDWMLFMPPGANAGPDRTAVFLSWFVIVRSWTLVSDDAVVFACVPSLAIMGMVGGSAVSPGVDIYFYVFVAAAIFLLIHQNYLQHRVMATPRERAREDGRVIHIQTTFAVLMILVVFILGAIIVVPVQSFLTHVPLLQTLRQLIGGDKGAGADTSVMPTHFSDDENFNIGTGDAQWSNSTEVVMHAAPDDNQEHYWRGRTYDRYTGTGWDSTLTNDDDSHQLAKHPPSNGEGSDTYHLLQPFTVGDVSSSDAVSLMKTTFDVRGSTDQFYYPGIPRRLAIDQDAPVRQISDGCLDRYGVSLNHARYEVYSAPSLDASAPSVMKRLRRAGTQYPPEVAQRYIGHLVNDDNSVTNADDLNYFRQAMKEALRSLPPSRRHIPFDEAVAIQTWVSAQCLYSLSVAPISPTTDHVHAFLATTRRGYCDLFASSMTVLCRTAHIPTRVVTGFAPGARDENGFSLRAMDKHAWVEVYFPGFGWATFDPTMGTRTDDSVKPPVAKKAQAGVTWTQTFAANKTVPRLLIGAILLILACIVKIEIYDRWRENKQEKSDRLAALDPAHARTEIGRHYARMIGILARLGLPRRASETPLEYQARALPVLTELEQKFDVPLGLPLLTQLTSLFAAARYSDAKTVTVSDWETLIHALTRFEAAAKRLNRAQLRHFVQQFLGGRLLNKAGR